MVISLLVLIREMALAMPAGASLISPWVDLTHSMPSISGADIGDFIPSYGYVSRATLCHGELTGIQFPLQTELCLATSSRKRLEAVNSGRN
jgi:acetyl esterase/lipase